MKTRLAAAAVAVAFAALFWWAYQSPGLLSSPPLVEAKLEARYGSSVYVVSQASGARDQMVAFTPALAGDDTVVLGALRDVVQRVYGDTSISGVAPAVEALDGDNY